MTSENPPSFRPVRVAHLRFGRDMLISPKGGRFLVVDGGETDRGMFVWLLPIGPDGFGIPGARRRRLYQDGTDGWKLDTPRPVSGRIPAVPVVDQPTESPADDPEIETGPGFPVACTSVHEHDPIACAPESPLAMLSVPDAILSTWTMAAFPNSPDRAQVAAVTITVSDFRAFMGHLSACGFETGPGNGEPEDGPEEVDGLPLYTFVAGPTGSLVFRREPVDFHPGGFPRAAAGPDGADTPDRYGVREQATPAGPAYGVLDTATGNIAHVAWGIETAGWYDDRAGARAAADQLSAAWRAAGGWSTSHYLPPSAAVIVRGPAGPEKWTGEKWNRHLDAASGSDQGISYTITRWY